MGKIQKNLFHGKALWTASRCSRMYAKLPVSEQRSQPTTFTSRSSLWATSSWRISWQNLHFTLTREYAAKWRFKFVAAFWTFWEECKSHTTGPFSRSLDSMGVRTNPTVLSGFWCGVFDQSRYTPKSSAALFADWTKLPLSQPSKSFQQLQTFKFGSLPSTMLRRSWMTTISQISISWKVEHFEMTRPFNSP